MSKTALGIAMLLLLAAAHPAAAKNLCLRDVANVPSLLDVVIAKPDGLKLGEVTSIAGYAINQAFTSWQFSGSAVSTADGIWVAAFGRRLGFAGGFPYVVLTWVAGDETFQGAGGIAIDLAGSIDVEVDLVSVDCATVPIP
jgi:hypothetical protein